MTEKISDKKTKETNDSSQNGKSKTYTVASGDTLIRISEIQLGTGAKYMQIYNANRDLIEQTAKENGYKSSENGKWIFPGTVLNIPN